MKIGTKTHCLANMSKSTKNLFEEYCDRVHKEKVSDWIVVSPQIAEKLNQITKQKNGRKRSESR